MRSSCLYSRGNETLKIAVFVSNYNTSDRLRHTLESLRCQTHKDFDIYLIDAGSSDGFHEVLTEYDDILYRVEQSADNGLYDGLSKAFTRADVGYNVYSYLNAGDLYSDYCLQVVSTIFSRYPVQWITGLPTTRDSGYRVISVSKPLPYISIFISNLFHSGHPLPAIQQESTFWSSQLHHTIPLSLFGSFRSAGDAFLWSHFAQTSQLFIVNCSLAAFTLHGEHLSSSGYQVEIGDIPVNNCLKLFLSPFALFYGLIQKTIRFPELVYRALPRVISLTEE